MSKQEIYDTLHQIEIIANLEKEPGVWYVENAIDEYRAKPTSYYATLLDSIEGLMESSDWFRPKGTGTIHYRAFGLNGKDIAIYSNEGGNGFGRLWI